MMTDHQISLYSNSGGKVFKCVELVFKQSVLTLPGMVLSKSRASQTSVHAFLEPWLCRVSTWSSRLQVSETVVLCTVRTGLYSLFSAVQLHCIQALLVDGLSFEQSPFILLSGKCRSFFLFIFIRQND